LLGLSDLKDDLKDNLKDNLAGDFLHILTNLTSSAFFIFEYPLQPNFLAFSLS
jgi:hypothetical protein